jgi:carotenoid cleavage dioxygenase-like enzyme
MTFLYDWETKKSEFVMWDAKTMSDQAVVRAPMNKHVPNGFHTTFVREDDLE